MSTWNRAGAIGLLAMASCLGEYVPFGDGSSTGSSTTTSTTAPTTTSADGSASSSAGPGSSSSSSSSTGTPDCPELDILMLVDRRDELHDNGVGLLQTLTSEGLSLVQRLQDSVCSVHMGVTTTANVPFNTNPACREIGALTVAEESLDDPPVPCGDALEGRSYLTNEDLDLTGLSCVFITSADQSDDADNVRPINAALEALGPVHNAIGGCNEGFFRPGAPLLLIIVTDADDIGTGAVYGPPIVWAAQLDSLQDSDLLSDVGFVLLVGLDDPMAGGSGSTGGDPVCPAERATNLLNFINGVSDERQIIADICVEESITAAFDEIFDSLIPTLLAGR